MIDLLQLTLESRGLQLEQSVLLELLTKGKFLLLFDGVNELPNDAALKELTELQQRYRQTSMIFTTRTLSVGSDLGIENTRSSKRFYHLSLLRTVVLLSPTSILAVDSFVISLLGIKA